MEYAKSLFGLPPRPFSFRRSLFAAGTTHPPLRAPWGKLLYSIEGIAEFTIEGERFLAPPSYAIWIPPQVLHESITAHDIQFASTYIHTDLCAQLPGHACTLTLTELVRAINNDFAMRDIAIPLSEEDHRLAMVLLDCVRRAPRHDLFLPSTDDALLAPVLAALRRDPTDRRSTAEWAFSAGTTERTFLRHCQKNLGMPFHQWRQRLRLVEAVTRLNSGRSVRAVSDEFGYSTPSAFIAMIKQMTGMSPTQLRRP